MDNEEDFLDINLMGIALMIGNYDERCVAQWTNDDGTQMLSTAQVFDGVEPFETAFHHPAYNEGKMVIVEAYGDKGSAAVGHAKWLKVIKDGPLPDELRDCLNSRCSAVAAKYGALARVYKRTV